MHNALNANESVVLTVLRGWVHMMYRSAISSHHREHVQDIIVLLLNMSWRQIAWG